jgi:hypothetical protein
MYVAKSSLTARPEKWVPSLEALLFPGEVIRAICTTANVTTKFDGVAVTNIRIGTFKSMDLKAGKGFAEYVRLDEISDTVLEPKKMAKDMVNLILHCDGKPENNLATFKLIDAEAIKAAIKEGFDGESQSAAEIDSQEEISEAAELAWQEVPTSVRWLSIPKAVRKALTANSNFGEVPKFIIVSGDKVLNAGALAGYSDRCVLVKVGAITSAMAGSFGGGRVATFYYRDITGVEYNAGMLSGVIEILTASYDGSSNKDFWQGILAGTNADANSPWTLSNTLPIDKQQFTASKRYFDELRTLISESKNMTVNVVAPTSAPDFTEQLLNLSKLHESGVLSDAEFEQAKARILGA